MVDRRSTDFNGKYYLDGLFWQWQVDNEALITISEPLYLQIDKHLSGINMNGWTPTEIASVLFKTLRHFDVIDENGRPIGV